MDARLKETIRKELLAVLEETFVRHHGIFTDKGTSLCETLSGIGPEKASRRYPGSDETIAGHVFHMRFYISVLREYITNERTGKTDWNESWTIKSVDGTEWENLKRSLADEYAALIGFIGTIDAWDNEDYFGGVTAIIAHCAYHLGAIRQLMAL